MRNSARIGIVCLAFVCAGPVVAGDVIDDWSSAKIPHAPALKPVTLDGGTTALLVLDLQKPSCTLARRARCVPTVPKVTALVRNARAAGAMIFFTYTGAEGKKPESPLDPALEPKDGEWTPQRGPDKFLGSDLEQRLKQRGIKTVIVTGSSAQGVVIGTGSGAAQRANWYMSWRGGVAGGEGGGGDGGEADGNAALEGGAARRPVQLRAWLGPQPASVDRCRGGRRREAMQHASRGYAPLLRTCCRSSPSAGGW